MHKKETEFNFTKKVLKASSTNMSATRCSVMTRQTSKRRQIWIDKTTKMDGLIPVTRPIREERPRTLFEAMEVDAKEHQGATGADREEEECKCASP